MTPDQTPSPSTPEVLAALKASADQSLFVFDQFVLGYTDMALEPHNELCYEVQRWESNRRKLILMPRGSFKSSVVTVGYTLWELTKNPNLRVMIGSEVNNTAKKFLGEIKKHCEQNTMLRTLYGNHVSETGWTEDEITSAQRTVVKKEPSIFTAGIDQTRTGMHADLIIVDDPVSNTNINTPESLQKTIEWYKLLYSILEPQGRLIVIGTRYHYADLYQHILDTEKNVFDVYIQKAIHEDGSLLFPTRLTQTFLDEIKASQGSMHFANQYQNEPLSSEDAPFQYEHLQWYDPGDPSDAVMLRDLNIYITLDPAISQSATADETAIVCVGIDQKNRWFVLEIDHGRMKPDEIIDRLFSMYGRHARQVRKIGVESVQYQKALIYAIRDEEKTRQRVLPIEELVPDSRKSKEQRIIGSLQPIVEGRRLFLQRGMLPMIDQLRMYPRVKHDDIIDALADIAQIAQPYHAPKKRGSMYATRAQRDDARDHLKWNVRSRFTGY